MRSPSLGHLGGRAYSLLITGLLTPLDVGASGNIRAAIFITDPDDRQLGMRSLLRQLYKLTLAEADLAALISEGEPSKTRRLCAA